MSDWLRKEISEGGFIPSGYGTAWRCPNHRATVCYPIPLNVAFGWCRRIWLDFQQWENPTAFDTIYWEGFNDGAHRAEQVEQGAYERGLRHGRERFRQQLLTEGMAAWEKVV